MSKIGIAGTGAFRLHDNGADHPESPDRLAAVERGIAAFASNGGSAVPLPCRPASVEELLLVHTENYVAAIAATAARERTVLDLDTSTNRWSYHIAMTAVGTAIEATAAVVRGEIDSAFCALRPPGHHAEAMRAMGFCIFNNAAVAARWAIVHGGLERVAIVDWDVHHGNGTMHSFYADPAVLYQSLHQFPHYPGTGTIDEIGSGDGTGFTVNVPLAPGVTDVEYLAAFDQVVVPVLAEFDPELIIISAGYDAHHLDTMASLELTSGIYAKLAARITGAAVHSRGTVALLEGGYHMTALEEGVNATLEGLAGIAASEADTAQTIAQPSRESVHLVRALNGMLAPYWRTLRD